MGEPVSPVPADAPTAPGEHRSHGQPARTWSYRNAAGELLGRVCRFDKPDGSKVVLPQTLWRNGGRLRWEWKQWPEPRPLYGLQQLATRPAEPVLVVEGEKTADAAGERVGGFVSAAWPGGSKATGKVDWSPLAGRDVVIWPDADEPGRKAAADVAACAQAAGALTVAIVDVPRFLPEGWDLADDWPEGFGLAKAEAAIADARAKAQPVGVEWPWGFRMDEDGLWYDQPTQNGGISPMRLSAPFEALGEARDPDGGGWAVVLRFRDRDGREKTVPVSRARLASGAAEVRAELADAGLIVSPARGKADKFGIALAEVKCQRRLTLVSATGWCGPRFVLPGQVIGAAGGEAVLFTGETPALHYRQAGSLDGWSRSVAALAEGNGLLTFALSLAFLGPLLRPLEIEGGGVHFRGSSSCGKTTLAHAAGSVWGGGGPLGFGQTWRSTANALEMVAYGHNDGLAVFDELALVAPEEAGSAAYSLASGQSKARSRADGSLRRRSEWRVAILSTGEIGLADHIRAGKRGERPMAGQELRLLDIAADAGVGMGVWEKLHEFDGPAALSDAIKAAGARDFGHAGPAFLDAFIARREEALAAAKEILAGFLKTVAREGDTGQAQRAALRFGAVAAAGELAVLFGVVPWPPGQAADAAQRLYHRWAAGFGRARSHEATEILRRLKGVIESERSAFSPIGDDDTSTEARPSAGGRDGEARGLKTYGFRQVRGSEVRYLFHGEGWAHVFRGFNPAEAARVVLEAGFLERGGEQRMQKRISIRGEKHWLYSVHGEILEASVGD
jgi:uncharacterized protein (DUF927 family)